MIRNLPTANKSETIGSSERHFYTENLTDTLSGLSRCSSIATDDYRIANDQSCVINSNQTEINSSLTDKQKNRETIIYGTWKSITQSVNRKEIISEIFFYKLDNNDFPKNFGVFEISKSLKRKSISTSLDNHRPSCCMTELFHPKSLVHIHDVEHRLFSILPLRTSPTDDELLRQKTNECVDQIFDLLIPSHVPCQMELVLPLYTPSHVA